MTLANKTIGNAIAGAVGYAWPVMIAVITTPYIVHKLGNDAYGILALVTSVLGFFAFLDLGVTSASIKYVAGAYAKHDIDEINKIIGSSLAVYLTVGFLGACIIALMTSTLVRTVLKIPPALISDSTFAFYLAAAGFLLNMILGVFASIPKAVQKYRVATKVNILIGTSTTLLIVLSLFLGYGFREVVIINFISSLVSLLIYLIVTKKIIEGVSIQVSFDPATFKKLFIFGAYSLLIMISTAFFQHLDKLLIGSFVDTASVSFYVIPANIALMIHSMTTSLMGVVFPLSSELHASGKIDLMKGLYLKASKYSFVFAISIATPIVLLAPKIMRYWMGAEYQEKSSLPLSILAISFFTVALTTVPHYLISGIGNQRINAFFAVLSGIMNIALCLLLIPRFGIVGAALANISNIVVVVLYLYFVETRIITVGLANYIKSWLRPLLVALVQGLVIMYVLSPFVTNLVELFAVLVLSFCLYYLVAFNVKVFDDDDKHVFKQYLSSLVKV